MIVESANLAECEACGGRATAIITYIGGWPQHRVKRPLCSEHGKIIWDAMSFALKETANIIDAREG